MPDLFNDYPDLYQALAAIGAEQRPGIGDSDVIARLTPEFLRKVQADADALMPAGVVPDAALAESFADIAQWPETTTSALQARVLAFYRLIR